MVYVVVAVGLLLMVGIHELVVRIARRAIQRPWAVMLGVVGAYAVLVGFAFALFTLYGVSSGPSHYVVEEALADFDARGKLEPGDTILEVDRVAVGRPGTSVVERVEAAGGKPVTLTIERAGQRRDVTVQPMKNPKADKPAWLMGVKTRLAQGRSTDAGSAATLAAKYPFVQVKNVARGLYDSFSGSEEVDIAGPVRIVEELRALDKPMFEAALLMLLVFGVYAWLALAVFDIVRMVGLARNSTARPR